MKSLTYKRGTHCPKTHAVRHGHVCLLMKILLGSRPSLEQTPRPWPNDAVRFQSVLSLKTGHGAVRGRTVAPIHSETMAESA